MPVFIFTHTSCTHIIYLDFISISVHIDTWDFILSLSLFVFVYLIDIRYPVGNSISDCRWPGAFCRRDLSADQSQWSIPPEMRDRGRAEADWGRHGRWGPRRWSWGGCSHETDHTKTCRQETDPATGFASHLVSGFGKSQEPGCSNEQPLEVAVFLASRGWWCRLGSASKCIGHKGCGQEARPEVAQQADVSHMPAGSANENPSSSTIQAVSLDVTQWISEEEAGTNSSIIHRRGQGWHRLCQREGPMACMLGGLRVQTLFWQIRRRPTDFFAAPKGQSPFSPCGACLSLALVLVFFGFSLASPNLSCFGFLGPLPGAVPDDDDPSVYRATRDSLCEVVPYELLGLKLVGSLLIGVDQIKFQLTEACVDDTYMGLDWYHIELCG